MDAGERMKAWTHQAYLIPLITIPLAWLASFVLYRWVIVCGGAGLFRCEGKGMQQLREPLAGMSLQADSAVRIAHDAAARFVWQPTLVAFVVVALGVIASCWYLIHRSLQDSVKDYGKEAVRTNVSIALGAVVVALLSWSAFPVWIVHTEVLAPTLEAALGKADPAVQTAKDIQQLLQVLACVASAFVVGAASAALLTPTPDVQYQTRDFDDPEIARYTTHLSDQWRRLTLTLYAGAALLVSAVVHQSAMYGWGNAFLEAMAETRALHLQGARAKLDSLQGELRLAEARIVLDTAQQRAAGRATARIRPDTSLRRTVALISFRVDSTRQTLLRDSVGGGTVEGATRATMVRIGELMTRAITRGGGFVYTILLAVTYLPAALVLMERAWELSFVKKPTPANNAKQRAEWRIEEGIGFSLGAQWSKVFAVFSPLIASGGAAYLFQLIQ